MVLCLDSNRFVFVNMDACMASQAVTLAVHKRLEVSGCCCSADMSTWSPIATLSLSESAGPALRQSCRCLTRPTSALPINSLSLAVLSSAPLGQGSRQLAGRGRAQALYGGLYSARNVALSGIHTHSGPGGYLQYVLYTITSLGFVRESFDPLVDGVMEVRARVTRG